MVHDASEQIVIRVSRNTLAANIALSAFKLFAGIAAHSSAMLSDAVHTLSDALSTVIVIIGVKMASKDSDKEHPYGHERFECVAALLLSAMLFITGAGIGAAAVRKISQGSYSSMEAPGELALMAAAASVVVKEAMYRYAARAAKRANSGALMADAWHHRSDAFSSIGGFAGIFGALMGYPVLDQLAAAVICVFIVKASFSIFADSIGRMTDRSCDDSRIKELSSVVMEQKGVIGIDVIKTRIFGNKVYVDVEISANGASTLNETHDAARRVHDAIERAFPDIKHCMVHVNPAGEPREGD
jgi:cation diffusion facilitator family transporter